VVSLNLAHPVGLCQGEAAEPDVHISEQQYQLHTESDRM